LGNIIGLITGIEKCTCGMCKVAEGSKEHTDLAFIEKAYTETITDKQKVHDLLQYITRINEELPHLGNNVPEDVLLGYVYGQWDMLNGQSLCATTMDKFRKIVHENVSYTESYPPGQQKHGVTFNVLNIQR
jgi:hypothetical protein